MLNYRDELENHPLNTRRIFPKQHHWHQLGKLYVRPHKKEETNKASPTQVEGQLFTLIYPHGPHQGSTKTVTKKICGNFGMSS